MRRIYPLLFSLVLAMSLLLSGCAREPSSNAADHVYSHRGAAGEETEHTFAAYDLAIAYGSKYIEQDVVLSKDGTLYVSHDLSAKKMTGVDALYSDLTDAEINALVTPDGHRILKLRDVFDRYTDTVCYVIELKDNGSLYEPFVDIVREYGYETQIIVQCTNSEVLKKLEAVFPDMQKLFLTAGQANFEASLTLDYIDILSVYKTIMTQENCDLAHQHQKQFNAWTLNTTEEIMNAIEIGVDSYFTDFTAKALLLEHQYRTK